MYSFTHCAYMLCRYKCISFLLYKCPHKHTLPACCVDINAFPFYYTSAHTNTHCLHTHTQTHTHTDTHTHSPIMPRLSCVLCSHLSRDTSVSRCSCRLQAQPILSDSSYCNRKVFCSLLLECTASSVSPQYWQTFGSFPGMFLIVRHRRPGWSVVAFRRCCLTCHHMFIHMRNCLPSAVKEVASPLASLPSECPAYIHGYRLIESSIPPHVHNLGVCSLRAILRKTQMARLRETH